MIKHRIRKADKVYWIELKNDSWLPVENDLNELTHDNIHQFINENFYHANGKEHGIITYHTRSFDLFAHLRGYTEIKSIGKLNN